MKFCGLCFLADARTSRFPPLPRLRRGAGGQKFISPTPHFLFARLLTEKIKIKDGGFLRKNMDSYLNR